MGKYLKQNSMNAETWVRLPYGQTGHSYYEVSNMGNIRSICTGIPRRPAGITNKTSFPTVTGDYVVKLLVGKVDKTCRVHRLVAEAFMPGFGKRDRVRHKNGNKADNRLSNLERCSISDILRRMPPMKPEPVTIKGRIVKLFGKLFV